MDKRGRREGFVDGVKGAAESSALLLTRAFGGHNTKRCTHTQMEDVGGQSKVNIFSTQYDKQVRPHKQTLSYLQVNQPSTRSNDSTHHDRTNPK